MTPDSKILESLQILEDDLANAKKYILALAESIARDMRTQLEQAHEKELKRLSHG